MSLSYTVPHPLTAPVNQSDYRVLQGGSTILGRLRLALSALAQSTGAFVLPAAPHFLWVTEFPLFTHADEDKEFLAHGRWSSSHHPFTAPMWEDIEKLYSRRPEHIAEVRPVAFGFRCLRSERAARLCGMAPGV